MTSDAPPTAPAASVAEPPKPQWPLLLLAAAAAFACTWLVSELRERRAHTRSGARETSSKAAARRTRGQAGPPPGFSGWSASGGAIVASRVIPEGIPVPPRAREVYRLQKPHQAWGGGYQGMFESPYAPASLLGFFRSRLPKAGWRFDPAFAAAGGGREPSSLRFVRGKGTVLVSLFPPSANGRGTDFRLSVTLRR